jgi:hypothetical protein
VVQYVDVNYAPDTDSHWSVAPGTLTDINAFAPLQNRHYGSVGTVSLGSLTGSDILTAQMFRQISGAVRFLTFRPGNIDEYDSSYVRTNRGTSYNASTTMWSAAAWGNQIIATNYLDAPQSSTGAGFTALSGSPPKARMVAANLDFVMFADVDDGGSNVYSDMVWWSGLRNPATWTPAPSTQAGNGRRLESPGPIRALVPFGKSFVVFKDNAIILGSYIGPPYVFGWQMVSSRVGCVGQNAVCELDGKLYFLHTSGFYEFDGQQVRQVGLGVTQTYLRACGYTSEDGIADPSYTGVGIAKTQAVGDDVEGVVWFTAHNLSVSAAEGFVIFGLNVRTGKWGRHSLTTATTAATASPLLRATTVDRQSFTPDRSGRIWAIWNNGSGTTFRSIVYPYTTTDSAAASFTTGKWGENDRSGKNVDIFLRHTGSTSLIAADVTSNISPYATEAASAGTAVTGVYNPEFASIQHTLDARHKAAVISYAVGERVKLAGLGLGEKRTGTR